MLEKISFDDFNDGSEIEIIKNNQDVSHSIDDKKKDEKSELKKNEDVNDFIDNNKTEK